MEALFSEFTLLSDQALRDKNFDPSTIEDLMKLFEVEAYKAWANLELETDNEVQKAHDYMRDSEEFRRFEEEMDRVSTAEHDGLVGAAEKARKMGKNLEKAATFASKKYIEAAVNSATASMRSAVRAISSNSNKVHPS
ncbi:uncharacterized protein LOC105169149 isoform X2 [Sesamum indicum]|uniref:Uncharacterized protein LOC105169149 isoform X2 n=1 Tax=Sesamum indicum TaxID=4182 RepID=A0A8M8V4K0_SESIN|nr:uncharacterized protein LOC105169149 isoform X2 [Sesamum indicum]